MSNGLAGRSAPGATGRRLAARWLTAWHIVLLLPLLAASGLALWIAPYAAVFMVIQRHWQASDRELVRVLRQVRPGQTESYVQQTLGAPRVAYLPADTGRGFPLEGVTWDGHPITGKVLVYDSEGELHAYIYLGRDGRVEHVEMAHFHRD